MASSNKRILLVEDTMTLGKMYEESLQSAGHQVDVVTTGQQALSCHKKEQFDLVLLDINLPDMSGLEVISILKQHSANCPVIMITGQGSMNTAVEAMRLGAQDFLVKPFQPEKLYQSVQRLLSSNTNIAINKNQKHKNTIKYESQTQKFIGTSSAMLAVYNMIEKAAQSNATVFITGDSGTGKEVCAETIHAKSARSSGPFVPINCGAIPRELIESELFGHVKGSFTGALTNREGAVSRANGGTLFLDEIGEMPYDMQTKLLRFLQNGTFLKVGGSEIETTDARIICATNRNPLQEVQEERFREDLYYRLHVLPIYMPPLNKRGDDILELAKNFLKRFSADEGKKFQRFSEKAEEHLLAFDWPGNIRQLQNTVRHAVVMHDAEIMEEKMLLLERNNSGFKSSIIKGSGLKNSKEKFIRPLKVVEREVIETAIEICKGNIPKAAVLLDVSPSTIYRKKVDWKH